MQEYTAKRRLYLGNGKIIGRGETVKYSPNDAARLIDAGAIEVKKEPKPENKAQPKLENKAKRK